MVFLSITLEDASHGIGRRHPDVGDILVKRNAHHSLRRECKKTSMATISVRTKQKDQIVDITGIVEKHLQGVKNGQGMCMLFVAHTTCALTTADLDPGTDLDFLDALRGLLPEISYRHPHDPSHTPDHILSSIIGPSLVIPYANHRLLLGTWQRIILVELDGPRQRTVHLSYVMSP